MKPKYLMKYLKSIIICEALYITVCAGVPIAYYKIIVLLYMHCEVT